MKTVNYLVMLAFFMATTAWAQNEVKTNQKETAMKTYVIERNVPGAGNLTAEELKAISQTSCGVLKNMGDGIVWDHSYVVGDKIFCIYQAQNEELVREHGAKGGFPVDAVYEVKNIISPATAGY